MENEKKKLGRYELLAKLATGGMAEIYLARQSGIAGFERLVVIKKLLPHLKDEKRFLEMFLDEARIVAQMSHPNIVQIHELGHEQGEYFIAMEYLEGESLGYLVRKALSAKLRLPVQLAVSIAAQVCQGLEYAHKLLDSNGEPLKVVHRDVSPQNIFVLFSGGVKLVDFGVAKAASKLHQTKAGTLKGKFAYMSPEQCLGQPVDARSDLFSLGIVLWEILSYRRLFKREQEAATIHAIINTEVPPPSKTNKNIPPELDSVVLHALKKSPDERFQSAGDMSAALSKVIRKMGKPAGVREMSIFMKKVFTERARTKKSILESLRSGDAKQISVSVLKPDTEESLPSRSAQPSVSGEKSSSRIAQENRPSGDQEHPSAPPPLPTTAKSGKNSSVKRPQGRTISTVRNATPIETSEPSPSVHEENRKESKKTGPAFAALIKENIIYLWVSILVVGSVALLIFWPSGKQYDQANKLLPADAGSSQGDIPSMALATSKPSTSTEQADGGESNTKRKAERDGSSEIDHTAMVAASDASKADVRTRKHHSSSKVDNVKHVPKTQKWGSLRLDTDPWSEVYLGKRKLGITPLLNIRLPTGRHRLKLVNPPTGKQQFIRVLIRPGKVTKLFKKL